MIPWLARTPSHRSAARRRLFVEQLEDRVVPTLSPVGPLTVASGNNTDSNPATDIAANDNDQSLGVVSWTQLNNNNNTDILASLPSAPGSIGSQITVANTSANEDNSDIAIAENGNFVVVWQATENNDSDILYALYRNNQVALSGVVSATSADEVNPQVAMDQNGNFVVTWTTTDEPSLSSNGQTVESQTVRAKLFNASGIENATILVAVSSTVDNYEPHIDMNSKGKFSISYFQSNFGSSINQKLFVENFAINSSVTGVSQKGTFKIFNAPNNGDIVSQDVAVDENANALVVFNQQTSSGTQMLSGRRVNGGSLASTFNLQAASFTPGTAVSVVMNATNKDFAVTFQFSSGDGPHAFVQEFFKNGSAQQTSGGAPVAFQLNSDNGASVDTENAAISIDSNNNYFVAYQTESNADDIDAQFGTLA